ncbi:MAG TPA: hypothetical protein VM165_01995, partial [Planctomycetaceae bacterium]|nr:hypothetical protein [Planctomycetaceae bacterium]
KDLNRAQQSSAINRGATSERIRWTGQNVERISPTPQRSLAHLLPDTQDDVARGDHPLSTHPFAEHPEPAPRRIKGMTHRHPLGDEAAFPTGRRSVTAVESEDDDWTNADEVDPVDVHTSQFNGRP